MNEDMWDGQWRMMRVHAREWWSKLTEEDLDYATGERGLLVSVLQQRYGWTRERAGREIDRHSKELLERGPVHTM